MDVIVGFAGCVGILIFNFILYLNRLSTERKRWFSRRCPDAGVGLGFGVGVFGHSGGRILLRSTRFTPLDGPLIFQ